MAGGILIRLSSTTLAILVFALAAFGQGDSGTITGRVTGPDKAAVALAPIQAKNMATGKAYGGISLPTGDYRISPLPAGTYELSVNDPLLGPFQQKDIKIDAGQTARIDIHLGEGLTLNTLGEDRASFIAIFGNRPTPPNGPTPRTADGNPDFSGLWLGPLPSQAQDRYDPLPWAEALMKERKETNYKDFPGAHCQPMQVYLLGPLLNQIVQNRTMLVTIVEGDTPGYRQIHIDGREHPKNLDPSWTGHSIGKWEGDTLVIDTIGFNDRTWLEITGNPHTEQLHMVTRLRRPDLGHLEIDVTFEDPGAYRKPWNVKGTAVLSTKSTDEVAEYICTENNQDAQHLVGK